MVSLPPPAHPEPAPIDADPSLASDFAHAKDIAGLIARAPRRHRRLAAAVFLSGVLASAAAALFLPRVYEVETRILAQRNLVMPSLGNPRRSIPNDTDAPTRAAGDVILGHDNLVAIIEETHLLARWDAERPAIGRLEDRVLRVVRASPSEDDRLRALIDVLEKRLRVQADDSTIRISLEWPNGATGYEVVSCAERNFFNGRRAVEVAVIADEIDILKAEADHQREAVDLAFGRVLDLGRDARAGVPPRPDVTVTADAPRPAASVRVPVAAAPEETRIASRLDDKRRAIRALDEPRQQKIAQLEADLARLRLTYTGAHPEVVRVETELLAARVDPPGLAELRQEERELVSRLADLASPDRERWVMRPAPPPRSGAASGASVVVDASPHEDEPELASAKTKLAAATRKYEDLMDRVDAARIELQTAQAAFKYRYTVVEPPEIPKEAKRPNGALLVIGGVLLSLVCACFAAAARDIAGGRFVEAWQVRRRLAVPVLAELEVDE